MTPITFRRLWGDFPEKSNIKQLNSDKQQLSSHISTETRPLQTQVRFFLSKFLAESSRHLRLCLQVLNEPADLDQGH